jgi:hypothetical protein
MADFHNLINKDVEILMAQKYFSRSSARLLPSRGNVILTAAKSEW